jgi:iron uptake system EfeUOB component EfeO/EfeM
MAKSKRSSSIQKLRIGQKLNLNQIESAFNTAAEKAIKLKGMGTQEFELSRVDILKNETVVFYRGDKDITDSLKSAVKKKSPKARLRVTKTTTAALAKAPRL